MIWYELWCNGKCVFEHVDILKVEQEIQRIPKGNSVELLKGTLMCIERFTSGYRGGLEDNS